MPPHKVVLCTLCGKEITGKVYTFPGTKGKYDYDCYQIVKTQKKRR